MMLHELTLAAANADTSRQVQAAPRVISQKYVLVRTTTTATSRYIPLIDESNLEHNLFYMMFCTSERQSHHESLTGAPASVAISLIKIC